MFRTFTTDELSIVRDSLHFISIHHTSLHGMSGGGSIYSILHACFYRKEHTLEEITLVNEWINKKLAGRTLQATYNGEAIANGYKVIAHTSEEDWIPIQKAYIMEWIKDLEQELLLAKQNETGEDHV